MSVPISRLAEPIPEEVAEQVRSMVSEACLALFQSHDLLLEPVGPSEEPALEAVAIIGFSATEMRGALGLAASQAALQESGEHAHVPPEDLDDWLSELANQLLGRLKNMLLRYQITLFMATPMTLRGLRLQIHAPEDNQVLSCHFRSSRGALCVWLDLRTQPGLVLIPSEDPEHQCTDEGELLFF